MMANHDSSDGRDERTNEADDTGVAKWSLENSDDDSSSPVAPPAEPGGPVNRFLEVVPQHVVPLGAGFLLTSSLVTLLATVAFGAMFATGGYAGEFVGVRYDFARYSGRMVWVVFQYAAATVFQSIGLYYAQKRTHWWVVLFSCLLGAFAIITIPLLVPALILLAVGKASFTGHGWRPEDSSP